MLFNTDGVEACLLYGGFLLAPLPSKKQLWATRDAHHWQLEKQRQSEDGNVFGIQTSGRMAKFSDFSSVEDMHTGIVLAQPHILAQPHDPTEEESEVNWTQWCSGMDDLGALVMLATSLRMEL